MYRLKILLLSFSALTTMSNLAVAQSHFLGSQHPIATPHGQGQAMSPSESQSPSHSNTNPVATPLKLEIEAAEPITISKDHVEKVDAYERYLKELKQWHLDGLRVAYLLKQEGKLFPPKEQAPNKLGSSAYIQPRTKFNISSSESWHRKIRTRPTEKIQFPKSVLDKMRPVPISVTRPLPTEVPLQLKFTNVSDWAIQLYDDFYFDSCKIKISVSGDRAFEIPRNQFVQTAEYRSGPAVTLKPGETHTTKLKRLQFGDRGVEGYCLRSPGKHKITIEYSGHRLRAFGGSEKKPISLPNSIMARTTVDVVLEKGQPGVASSSK